MTTFEAALASLKQAGTQAQLQPADVVDEAAAFTAAICADVAGAELDWSDAFGRLSSGFAGAARLGKPWLTGATPLLQRLVDDGSSEAKAYAIALGVLAVATADLDPDPSLPAIEAGRSAAQVQLRAANVAPNEINPRSATRPRPENATPAPTKLPELTLPELLEELDALVGLAEVKAQVHQQTAVLRMNKLRAEKGLKAPSLNRHLVFVGNPGTGKTTVARLVAGIYRALGLLSKGELIETDRSGLVAGYLGQTALKTKAVIDAAVGSVLFIDEAYALATDNFGEEAVATLVKGMEDHRADLVVIVAGYPGDMKTFIETNPGLESRFGTTIEFPDYTDDELVAIFQSCAKDADFEPTAECITQLRAVIAKEPRDEGFGNGRFARNLFEAATAHHAWRLRDNPSPTLDELRRLEAADVT